MNESKYMVVDFRSTDSVILSQLKNAVKELPYSEFRDNCYHNVVLKITDTPEGTIEKFILNNSLTGVSYDVIEKDVSPSDFKIMYTDGSHNHNTGWAVAELTNVDPAGKFEYFTGLNYLCNLYCGTISMGTNNVGELTAIRKALNHIDSSKKFQLIISDSEYSINCEREWYERWEKSGFLSYSKKPIVNKDIILDIKKAVADSKCTVLFMWTQSHIGTYFNELCDKTARSKA
jgi:ribonuclease HI